VNERGFAIVNSASTDLPSAGSGETNGLLMKLALGRCATVAEFEAYLAETNGNRSTQANFAVIDTTGAAAIFETSGFEFWKYDANNPTDAPNGYIVKTNFAHHGDGSGGGYERYYRTAKLIEDFYTGDSLNHRSILRTQMRDFSDFNSDPVSVPFQQQWISTRPYGYIYTGVSICRSSTVSTAVIHGVLPYEPAFLSTMWTILGQPASSIAVPYWPVGLTPLTANGVSTAPLADKANEIKALLFDYSENTNYIDSYKLRDEQGNGLWAWTCPAEDSIFSETAELMNNWRINIPQMSTMLAAENDFANYTLSILNQALNGLITGGVIDDGEIIPKKSALHQNYPNPFNSSTIVSYDIINNSRVQVVVYNLLGQLVAELENESKLPGRYSIIWNPDDLAGGVYFIQLTTDNFRSIKRSIYIK
jgi:hypothetical protein